MAKKTKKSKSTQIGQITVKKVGDMYAVCISGSPKRIEKFMHKAELFANKLRKKHGRRLKKDY